MKFQVHLTCVFWPTFTTIYIYTELVVVLLLVAGCSESGVSLVSTIGSSPTHPLSQLTVSLVSSKWLIYVSKERQRGPWHVGRDVGGGVPSVAVDQLKWKVVTRIIVTVMSVSQSVVWTHGHMVTIDPIIFVIYNPTGHNCLECTNHHFFVPPGQHQLCAYIILLLP